MIDENVLMTEASFADSVIFKSSNNNAELSKSIIEAYKNSTKITPDYIQEQLIMIKKTRISPLSENVLDAYRAGKIVICYAEKSKKVPQAIPFFATKQGGNVRVILFVNNYATISVSKSDPNAKYLNMTMKDLYVLMEGAYVAYMYATSQNSFTKNLPLMKICASIYSQMFLRILNKEYAISMDQAAYQQVQFSIARFFLENVWMYKNEDVIFSYACSTIPQIVNKTDLMMTNEMYTQANITNIKELIAFIKSLTKRLSKLNFRYFLQCYINTYKACTMFGIECAPYFLYTIEASMIGSFLVNQPIISDITKNIKGMNQFYPELLKAVS